MGILALRFFALRLAILVFAAGCIGSTAAAVEPRPTVTESDAKAAALYHLVHFTTWPADSFAEPDSPIVIGVYGRDPFGPVLEDLMHGESSQGHPLSLRHVATPEDAASCHILFIPQSESGSLDRVLQIARRHATLTVSDGDNFIERGGIVRLTIRDQHIHITIDLKAARRADLVLSAKLLKLAEVVNGKGD